MNAPALLTPDPITPSDLRSAPPRVLHFYLDFGEFGGIETWLLQATRLMKERGRFEPVVVCSANTPLYRRLKQAGIRTHGIRSAGWARHSVLRSWDRRALADLESIIRQEKPALIHVHIGLGENSRLRDLGIPVVYTLHGYGSLYSMPQRPGLKNLWKGWVRREFRKTAARMDALLAVSHSERERLQREGFLPDNASVRILPNAVPVDALQHEAENTEADVLRIQLGLPHDARCITYINRLDANKNPRQFLELARRLSAMPELGPLAFLLAGDGPLQEAIREEAADLDNVYVLGRREDVPSLLAISELVIHPASREAFGLGLLEAMATGTPCLAYASEGPAEILDCPDGKACLVPIGDLQALTRQAATLLTLPATERLKLGRRLQQRAADFDILPWIEQLEAVYQQTAPLVSVILPVYNGETSIRRAVDSVLGQSYPHLELIVVDDGSTDHTRARLQEIRDPRLRVIVQENAGVAAARNRAFEWARGEYVAYIDADDRWLPDKLAAELAVLSAHRAEENPVALVVSGYHAVDARDRLLHKSPMWRQEGDLSEAVLEEEGIFLPSTTLVHRRIVERLGGFEPGCYHEDRAFFIRACQQFPTYVTGRRLVLYRQSEDGRCRRILSDEPQALRAELSIIETLAPHLNTAQLTRLKGNQLRNLVLRFLMYGHMQAARRLYAQLPPEVSLTGRKGQLARLSLRTGINGLRLARQIVQGIHQLLSPMLLPKGGSRC